MAHALTDQEASFPLDEVRAHWRRRLRKTYPGLLAEIAAWQGLLWKFVKVGSYVDGNTARQVPNDAAVIETQTLKLNLKPAPGQSEVVLYLTAQEIPGVGKDGHVDLAAATSGSAGQTGLAVAPIMLSSGRSMRSITRPCSRIRPSISRRQ